MFSLFFSFDWGKFDVPRKMMGSFGSEMIGWRGGEGGGGCFVGFEMMGCIVFEIWDSGLCWDLRCCWIWRWWVVLDLRIEIIMGYVFDLMSCVGFEMMDYVVGFEICGNALWRQWVCVRFEIVLFLDCGVEEETQAFHWMLQL